MDLRTDFVATVYEVPRDKVLDFTGKGLAKGNKRSRSTRQRISRGIRRVWLSR